MKLIKNIFIATVISGFTICSAFATDSNLVKKGEEIFMTKNKGNCLACHGIEGKTVDGPGSMGPTLMALQYWPEQALYDKVYDPYTTNPISAMPAFGKNGWLSDDEIKAVVAYLKTIK